jgi:hypothetical protein
VPDEPFEYVPKLGACVALAGRSGASSRRAWDRDPSMPRHRTCAHATSKALGFTLAGRDTPASSARIRQVDGLRRLVATFGCDVRTTSEVRRPSKAGAAAAAAPAAGATGTAGGSSASAGAPDADTTINAERQRSRRRAVERGRMPMRLQSATARSKSNATSAQTSAKSASVAQNGNARLRGQST